MPRGKNNFEGEKKRMKEKAIDYKIGIELRESDEATCFFLPQNTIHMLRYAIHYISYTTIIAPFFYSPQQFLHQQAYLLRKTIMAGYTRVLYGMAVVWFENHFYTQNTKASIIVTFNFHPIKIACQKE